MKILTNEKPFTDLRAFAYRFATLLPIARQLHNNDENICNLGDGVNEQRTKRTERLEKDAQKTADMMGLVAYHQGDPRGCSLYLLPQGMTDAETDRNYSDGIPVCD